MSAARMREPWQGEMGWRGVLWLGMLSVATSSLFVPQGGAQSIEVPIHLATSIHGNHAHIPSPLECQYVLTESTSSRHEESIEWIWQSPELNGRGHVLRGIVFLAHGCNHHATDFFHVSPACPKCIGLPEEVRMSGALLRQQYAVVAISSLGHCWSEQDFGRVKQILNSVLGKLGGSLPLYAIGASSGGSFVAHLPNHIPGFKAVVIQIMSVAGKSLVQNEQEHMYPPSLWIAMEQDERTMKSVMRTVNQLTHHNIAAELIKAKSIPLFGSYFSDRIAHMPPEVSANIVQSLRQCGLLDNKAYLLNDPRETDWRECLKRDKKLFQKLIQEDSLLPDESAISEELNVAYAMHELTANHMSDIINFIMKYK